MCLLTANGVEKGVPSTRSFDRKASRYSMDLSSLSIEYSVVALLTGPPIGYSVIVALTGLPIQYSVIVALTGLPIGYSVIIALTDPPVAYSVVT